MIVKHSRETSKSAANTGLAKVAVQCSADTFVVNQSSVLRINICGANRHLRQARNRWAVASRLWLHLI
jgi:hypothetical protein